MFRNKYSVYIKVIVIVLFCVSAIIITYSSFKIRVVSSSVTDDILPTSTTSIEYTFNHYIGKNPKIKISGSMASYKYTYSVDNNRLNIRILTPLDDGGSLSIDFSVLSSLSSGDFSEKYAVKYIDFNELPKKEQEKQIATSSSFEGDYPIVGVLPILSDSFEIDYQYPPDGSSRLRLIITSLLVNTDDPEASPSSDANLSLIREARDDALKYIKDNGYNPLDYDIYYTEPYLIDEYNGYSVDD